MDWCLFVFVVSVCVTDVFDRLISQKGYNTMKCKVLGIERVNYTKKDGKEVNGASVYVSEGRKDDPRVKGVVTSSIWIPLQGEDDVASYVSVGAEVEVQYNRWGRMEIM